MIHSHTYMYTLSLHDALPISKTVPCVVVLFVRRQDRWIDSYFNQMVKVNEIHEDISTFVGRLCDTDGEDRKSTRLNSSHGYISYAVFCLTKKQTILLAYAT